MDSLEWTRNKRVKFSTPQIDGNSKNKKGVNEMKYEIVATEHFFEKPINVYKDKNNEIYMTRKQIGEALEYANPSIAISKIHARNKERLDKFSRVTQIGYPSEKGGEQDTVLYTERGIYEIMRYSKKPKANEFYDFVYELLSKIRKREIAIFEQIPKNYEEAIEQLLFQIRKNKELERKAATTPIHTSYSKYKNYYEAVLDRKLVEIEEIAQDYAIGLEQFQEILQRVGILERTNKPTQEMYIKGFVESIQKIQNHQSIGFVEMWTQSGVLHIYQTLKAYNVVPILDLVTKIKE